MEKGRLKIFLGLAAGVGKTYAMLEAAQQKVIEGVRVLVGTVNTHGRTETAKLLEPLKILPEKIIHYKERNFNEMDLDEIIRLKPDLAVVDELAHSNVTGSKHLKRWQDVMEILDAGIDVFTTLNIQHIESYKDIVEKITGIRIRETVPDLILNKASVTYVDITPPELIQRLKEGKVYTGDFSEIALKNFFQEDRLTALREVALRCTAEVVDLELNELIKEIPIGKEWRPRERLLVAINHHPYAQQLIRTTRRLSLALHAPWFAVFVDTGKKMNGEEASMLSKNLTLARELGAQVETVQDLDVSKGIQRVAEQKKITEIIVGKSLKKKIFGCSSTDHLTKITSGIDVHIIRQSVLYQKKQSRLKIDTLTSFLISKIKTLLTTRVQRCQKLLRKKEQFSQAIYDISDIMISAPTSTALFGSIKERLQPLLEGECEILVRKKDGNLDLNSASPIMKEAKEKGVAKWVFENGKEAGWSTFTLSSVKNLYIPLKGFKEVLGVLSFRPLTDKPLLPEESDFLYIVVQFLSNFLERSFAEERERKNELLQQVEDIYVKVLQSIADELSHPLLTVQHTIEGCKEDTNVTQNKKLSSSLQNIENAFENLMRIAENASSMAKLSGGLIKFEKAFHTVDALINESLDSVQKSLKQHQVKVYISQNIPALYFDFSLMSILLYHLLLNAIEYSPAQTLIEIEAEVFDGTFALSVSDEGRGIPEEMMERVFEKFYRWRGAGISGLGLGLAIVKSIAEIHQGYIKVQNRAVRGSKFTLILPMDVLTD